MRSGRLAVLIFGSTERRGAAPLEFGPRLADPRDQLGHHPSVVQHRSTATSSTARFHSGLRPLRKRPSR